MSDAEYQINAISERNALRKELADLRARLARAAALAVRIVEADGRAKELNERMLELMGDYNEGARGLDALDKVSVERADAESEAYNARKELAAMFAEGK